MNPNMPSQKIKLSFGCPFHGNSYEKLIDIDPMWSQEELYDHVSKAIDFVWPLVELHNKQIAEAGMAKKDEELKS